jgi:hypothetical protein
MTEASPTNLLIGAACNLSEEDLRRRVAEWRALRDRATSVTPIEGGVVLQLPANEPISDVADLAGREIECCPFYSFALHVDGTGRRLHITAGPGGERAIDGLLGLELAGG